MGGDPGDKVLKGKEEESGATSESTAIVEVEMPQLEVRWAHTGTKQLALPTAPISGLDATFKVFSSDESDRIEDAWQALPAEERQDIVEKWGKGDGEWSEAGQKAAKKAQKAAEKEAKKAAKKKGKHAGSVASAAVTSASESEAPSGDEKAPKKDEQYQSIIEKAQNDPSRLDSVEGIPVSQDSLFEVDLNTLSLHPVFWPQAGPRVPVLRGTWFMGDETHPCTWDLALELEKAYQEVKPWQPTYIQKLQKATAAGAIAEEKLRFRLPERFGPGLSVIFQDATKCRIITSTTFDYLSRAIWSSLGSKPGGTYLYRGYTAAAAANANGSATSLADSRRGSDEKQAETQGDAHAQKVRELTEENEKEEDEHTATEMLSSAKDKLDERKKALEEQHAPVIQSHDGEQPCTDLFLVIHGIGQHLAAQYESFNFIYASNTLRQIMRKQSSDPALKSIMAGRRSQILPVQWRANLNLDSDSSKEDHDNEKDNVYTVADITIGKSIPYIREVTNSVLLDIPLFMSPHREKMIQAVCKQANKMYRLWIARHPDFEKYGRVHIIGHSLGSALAAHILSNQPTLVPPLSQLPTVAIEQATDRFVFNTSNVYLAGSPLGVFLQLQQAHMIARAGRKRTMNALSDEALLHPGEFGCLSSDSVYNVFYYTDPVAYGLNATVDVAVAKTRPPLAIPSVVGSMFPAVPMPSMPAMPSLPAMPTMPSISDMTKYLPSYFGGTTGPSKEAEPKQDGTDSIEMTSKQPLLAGTRGERRFAALNPRGGIDFYLPSSSVNDYLDMITAHGNYWSDPNFAAFLLAETFASESDVARTDVVAESVASDVE